MKDKLKNIILFAGILVVLVLGYMFFTGAEEDPGLVSTEAVPDSSLPVTSADSQIAGDFLAVLLSIRGIKLDTSLFSDPAFISLRDSSIELVQDGTEGRPNPFAPIGSDIGALPVVAPTPEPIP